jgi:transcriptional regulator NrdR family protein
MGLSATGPNCPSCGAWITKVILSKLDDECSYIIRRRHCQYCDHRFYSRQATEELVDIKWVSGAKGSGTIPKIIKVLPTPMKARRVA